MLNLSLSGCGFLGIYHIGVISAFREHAPEFLQSKITGCSAGALVAACAVCDCCLGQMVADTIEIALKARHHALGPLHPSFSIVDILRNGLRRILPIDAHKLCSGRVFISLTRWKDGKNVLVSQFDTREELIQALICTSFVPMYSGFIPPKFKGTYYWDGGLSDNNPILDENTVTVSPFGGESDICPREESSSFYCILFQGTNIQWSSENFYRISKALFPPSPEILKAICFRGYKDAITFLKSRNLLRCSCYKYFRDNENNISINSLIDGDLHKMASMAQAPKSETQDENDSMIDYDSDEEKITQYAHTHESLDYAEMPKPICEVLDAACDDNKGLINYVYNSQVSRAISIMFLPWTLPFEISLSFTRKLLELLPKVQVTTDSNLVNYFSLYMNFLLKKLTHDKFQYHARVTCKLCLQSMGRHRGHLKENEEFNHCHHSDQGQVKYYPYLPKLCARHRVPSICNSEAMSQYHLSRQNRTHSRTSSSQSVMPAGKTSTIDRHEIKNTSRYYRRKRRNTASSTGIAGNDYSTSTRPSFKKYAAERDGSFENECSAISVQHTNFNNYLPESTPQISNKVYFHLGDVDETSDGDDELLAGQVSSSLDTEQQLINFIKTANLTDNEKLSAPNKSNMSVLSSASSATLAAVASSSLLSAMNESKPGASFMFRDSSSSSSSSSSSGSQSPADMTMDETGNSFCTTADTTSDADELEPKPAVDKTQLSWDSYWDGLESVVLGHTNNTTIK